MFKIIQLNKTLFIILVNQTHLFGFFIANLIVLSIANLIATVFGVEFVYLYFFCPSVPVIFDDLQTQRLRPLVQAEVAEVVVFATWTANFVVLCGFGDRLFALWTLYGL